MADTPISGLTALATAPAVGDWFVLVDVSDTTQAATGSTKKIATATVFTSPTIVTPTITTPTITTPTITGAVGINGLVTITPQLNHTFADLSLGSLAVMGDYYDHVIAAFGNGAITLTATHQVGVYSTPRVNSFATGAGSFNAGFETSIGAADGANVTLENATNYMIGSMYLGAGSTITRTWGLATFDEIKGDNNAAIARYDDPYTGDWFIHYHGTRASYFGGAVEVFGDLTLPPESYRSEDTSYVRIFGGTTGSGASLVLFGGTHATDANKVALTGSASVSVTSPVFALTGDLTLPGGSFGITNDTTRFLTIATGANPALGFATTGTTTFAGPVVENGTVTVGLTAAKDLVIAGGGAALATNATVGFLYLTTCAGAPTGAPTAPTGTVPMIVDTTNSRIYFRIGGAWKQVTVA